MSEQVKTQSGFEVVGIIGETKEFFGGRSSTPWRETLVGGITVCSSGIRIPARGAVVRAMGLIRPGLNAGQVHLWAATFEVAEGGTSHE